MAIYHLSASTGSKGSGSSARQKASYDMREEQYANRTDCAYRESGNMPAWAADNSRAYWQAADEHERSNGRLYKSLEFSLPQELNRSQQIALSHDFADHLTRESKLPYSFAIHDEGKGNPHVHLMISERVNDGVERTPDTWFKRANTQHPERGGAKKTTELMPKKWLFQTRADWSERANIALEKAGHEQRIDHRSLADQGITDRLPQVHIGPNIEALEAKGIKTHRMAEYRERQTINERLTSLAQECKVLGQEIRVQEVALERLHAAQQAGEAERAGQTIDTHTSLQDARHERDHEGADASLAQGAGRDHSTTEPDSEAEQRTGRRDQAIEAGDIGGEGRTRNAVATSSEQNREESKGDLGKLWAGIRESSQGRSMGDGLANGENNDYGDPLNSDLQRSSGVDRKLVDGESSQSASRDISEYERAGNGDDFSLQEPASSRRFERDVRLEQRETNIGLQGASSETGQEWVCDTRPLKRDKHEAEAREHGISYMESVRKRWEASKEWMSRVAQRMGIERLTEVIHAYREGKVVERNAKLKDAASAADLGGYRQGVKDIQAMAAKVNQAEAEKRRVLGAVERGEARSEKHFYAIEKQLQQNVKRDKANAFDNAEKQLQGEKWSTDLGRRMALDKLNEARHFDQVGEKVKRNEAISEIGNIESGFGVDDNHPSSDELQQGIEQAEQGDWQGARQAVQAKEQQVQREAQVEAAIEQKTSKSHPRSRRHGMGM